MATNADASTCIETGAARRSSDLGELLTDPEVGLILSTTGGYLSLLTAMCFDTALFAMNPKPIVGFSDATALLLALHAATGLVTFHGPALLPSLGERPFDAVNWRGLMDVVTGGRGIDLIRQPASVYRGFRFWDRDDADPAEPEPAPPLLCLSPGVVEGPLIGGNLDTLVALAGTPFLPALTGAVLFWEVAFSPLDKLQRDLACLEAAGVFDAVAGMVVGAPFRLPDADDDIVIALSRDIARRYRLPTVFGAFVGHCQPIATMPIGARVSLDAEGRTLVLLEAAVDCRAAAHDKPKEHA